MYLGSFVLVPKYSTVICGKNLVVLKYAISTIINIYVIIIDKYNFGNVQYFHYFAYISALLQVIVSATFGIVIRIQKMMMMFVRYARKWSKKREISFCPMRHRYA